MKTGTKTKKVDKAKPDAAAISEIIKFIPLEDLLPNPYQPASRGEVDAVTVKKFALSIQQHGLIQTPVVRPGKYDGKYEIADGWLRRAGFAWLAQEVESQKYGKMPCVVRELTDQQMADMVLEANTIRKDLNPMELAKLYKQYLDDFKIPQVELARRHNCSQGEIANTIRLLDLPADIQEKIISQEISETHGRQFLRLNYNPELQQKELKECIQKGSSVSELSNSINGAMYHNSENIDPTDYSQPPFDTKDCEKCPNRQKIGYYYSNEKKTWRCLDKKCFEKKEQQAEQERIAKLQAEIQAAKEAAPQQGELPTKGKKKGKKEEAAVIDTQKLTWRDYHWLDEGDYQHIDNPEQCNTCAHRAIGRFFSDRTGPICINVKCFKEKEKTYQAKEAAKTRQAEQDLTEKVKAVCAGELDHDTVLKMVAQHLIEHSRSETRQKFQRMYKIADISAYFASSTDGDLLQKLAAFILQMERLEGQQGLFMKMMANLEGTGADLEKQIADFKEKHCKTCRNGLLHHCLYLMRVYYTDKCYGYSKEKEGEEPLDDDEVDDDLEVEPSADPDNIEVKLPCKDCANAPTCDRTFFYANDKGGLSCDQKKELKEANAT